MANNAPAKKETPTPAHQKKEHQNSIQIISGRQSKELIIAFCGAIGAGIKSIKKVAKEELEELGYQVVDLRISELMKTFPEFKTNENDYENLTPELRYIKYQDLGDSLRQKYNTQILAEAAINEIKIKKETARLANQKIAYLIDQLKNPSEVELFRLVYQNNFYLVGVIRSEEERKRNLRDEGIPKSELDNLIHRDRKSNENHGQQSENTILDSDIFIRNRQSHLAELKKSIKRFFNLIHGMNGITPTRHEKGMYSAFSASLQSACLSRQVGASIMDINGNILATGKNDVPKPFGGLYSSDDEDKDYRCIHKGGKCYNDSHKAKFQDKIIHFLTESGVEEAKSLGEKLYKKIGISSLLEFSRSIHAEMDAITSLARTGNAKTEGTTLYTTTYPCHNCARHIVASGIKKAIYIEPYEKSLAIDLHDDAITNHSDQNKVEFEAFEGISPRRYPKFFFPSAERKKSNGEAVKITTKYQNHVDIQFLDSYGDYETKVSNNFIEKLHT